LPCLDIDSRRAHGKKERLAARAHLPSNQRRLLPIIGNFIGALLRRGKKERENDGFVWALQMRDELIEKKEAVGIRY
jgi:hypothetical protein